LNDWKAAEDQFEAAVLLQPGSSEAQIDLAKALVRRKKFSDAVELLEPVAGSSTSDPEVFVLLAEAYAELGRREDAQRAELRAKALQKSKPLP
jgi:predicted Zn-dependent protease